MNPELVQSLVASLTSRLETQIQDAAQGRFSGGGPDIGKAITLLNVWHPESANWDIVYRLLGSTRWGDHLNGALGLLADKADDLPDDVTTKLISLAEAIADGTLLLMTDPRPPARRRCTAALERSRSDT